VAIRLAAIRDLVNPTSMAMVVRSKAK
jgi:hypothetical protein